MIAPDARDAVIRTIIGEAGGEPPEGWQAVANVIKNRIDSGQWGPSNSVGKVLFAPKQFSTWNPDIGNPQGRAAAPGNPLYDRIGQIVDGVFNNQLGDVTGGATHYFAPQGMAGGQPPAWAANGSNVRRIGNHIFMTLPTGNMVGATDAGPTQPSVPGQQPTQQPVQGTADPIIHAYTGGYANTATRNQQPFNSIVMHASGRPDLQSELAYMRTPDAGRGGNYFGYHFLIDRNGQIYQTAPMDQRTNHIMGNQERGINNSNAVGIALIGDDKGATPEQMAAGRTLVDSLRRTYNIGADRVVAHGEIQADRAQGLNPNNGPEAQDFMNFYRNPTANPNVPANAYSGPPQPGQPTRETTAADLPANTYAGPVQQQAQPTLNQGPETVGSSTPAQPTQQTPPNQGPELVGTTAPAQPTQTEPLHQTADLPAPGAQPTVGPASALPGMTQAPARELPMGQGDQSTQHERSNMNAYIQPGAVIPTATQGEPTVAQGNYNRGYGTPNRPLPGGSGGSGADLGYTPQGMNKGWGTGTGPASYNKGIGGTATPSVPAAVARSATPAGRTNVPLPPPRPDNIPQNYGPADPASMYRPTSNVSDPASMYMSPRQGSVAPAVPSGGTFNLNAPDTRPSVWSGLYDFLYGSGPRPGGDTRIGGSTPQAGTPPSAFTMVPPNPTGANAYAGGSGGDTRIGGNAPQTSAPPSSFTMVPPNPTGANAYAGGSGGDTRIGGNAPQAPAAGGNFSMQPPGVQPAENPIMGALRTLFAPSANAGQSLYGVAHDRAVAAPGQAPAVPGTGTVNGMPARNPSLNQWW